MLERGNIEIANKDCPLLCRLQLNATAHVVQEREFVGELRIDIRIRFVAARGHVKIMDFDRIPQPGFLAKRDGDMAGSSCDRSL
jgi:hypothetical protein